MSKYYVVDTSKASSGKSPVILFETTEGVITYLEGSCQRRFGQSRTQFMQSVNELGFGDDDAPGRNFFEQMEQYFQMGVIRGDSVPIKCNIFEAEKFSKVKDVHGN
jgi:hypothetical protein